MGAWGVAIFSDDLACDVRFDWREAILEALSVEDATAKVVAETDRGEDQETVFWLALAAAQMETGRLHDEVRDRALEIIASGSDLESWRALQRYRPLMSNLFPLSS